MWILGGTQIKPGKITKFFVDSKILRRIPLYFLFRNYLVDKYRKELINSVTETGRYTINHGTLITASDKYKLKIGNFCSIAPGVTFILSSAHRTDWVSTFPFIQTENTSTLDHIEDNRKRGLLSSKGDIIIGNDVWIGGNATIMSGVKIGDGAVIGAGSVVTRDVSDYEIVAGNPARRIRYRFKREEIKELKKIRWWNWSIEKIMENRTLMESSNIKKFIENNREIQEISIEITEDTDKKQLKT